MQKRKLAVAAGAVGVLTMSVLSAAPAFADYAPGSGDVVGVGSDTVQYAIDFTADGDYVGDPGYNLGQKNRVVNFDATPDANARLAYGSNGLGSGTCTPGTGTTAGTGNQNTTHADKPCTLNPTIVLRAGTKPVLRPNGSGAGYNALKADDVAGTKRISFSRASSPRGANALYDSVNVGTDNLAMLSASTSNAVALSTTQLKGIYECSFTNWNQVGGVNAPIVALIPQVGSGTRSSFLANIGSSEAAITLGGCAVAVEENDPEAIDGSTSPINAIEPMSSGRLNMYLGNDSTGTSLGLGGYFTDPSCTYAAVAPAPACTTGKVLAPNVKYWTTGTPTVGSLYNVSRSMYVYFRDADINLQVPFQLGSNRNWVRTLYYNPCSGTTAQGVAIVPGTNCVSANTYGPGGSPYIIGNTALIEASGISTSAASYGAFALGGP